MTKLTKVTRGVTAADPTVRRDLAKTGMVKDIGVPYGQSNAQGQPYTTEGALSWINPLAEMFDGSNVVPLSNSMPTPDSGTFGGSAWPAFANEYIERTGRPIVLVNCAKGGQSIAQLSKGTSNYSNMLDWIAATTAAIEADGDTVGEVFLLFNQGEQDQVLDTPYHDYYNALSQLWADVVADTQVTKMFLWTLGLYLSTDIRGAWGVQLAQRHFCGTTPGVVLAYDDLGGFTQDSGLRFGAHYTMAGYNLMGVEGAKTVAFSILNNGAEAAPYASSAGSVRRSYFQRHYEAGGIFTKVADNGDNLDWTYANGAGATASFITEVNSTADPLNLRLQLAAPASQIQGYNSKMEDVYERLGLRSHVSVSRNANNVADDYVNISFSFSTLPLRVRMAVDPKTVDSASLGSAWSSLFGEGGITLTDPDIVGRVIINHPNGSAGLGWGSPQLTTAKSVGVDSGATSSQVRVYDGGGALVNDEVAVFLPNAVVPHGTLPIGTTFSADVCFATYQT